MLEAGLAEAIAGRGSSRLIKGPPGVGKSELLRAAGELAAAAGAGVLTARAGELERGFAYGVVRQLLEPALAAASPPEREAMFEGAAGLASPLFEPLTALRAGAQPDVSEGTLYGLFWLAASAVEHGAALLTVDDLHWCDPPHAALHRVPRSPPRGASGPPCRDGAASSRGRRRDRRAPRPARGPRCRHSAPAALEPGRCGDDGRVDARRSGLLREGLARLLEEAGFAVVGKAGTAEELVRRVELTRPDIAIVDIKMPPTHTDEGLVAAQEIRRSHPQVGVLLLSHYVESRCAMRLLEEHTERSGYLLKERASDVAVLVDALRRVADGECVVDPTIVSRLVRRPREQSPLEELTERELEVLALMAEGHSNDGICKKLFLSPKTVETHVRHILLKLGIGETTEHHRRVLAVLTYLRG